MNLSMRTVSKRVFNDTRNKLRGGGRYVKRRISRDEFVGVTESKDYPSTLQNFPHVYTVYVNDKIYTLEMDFTKNYMVYSVEEKEVSGMN
jgi:hypothetical protein